MVDKNEMFERLRKIASRDDHSNYNVRDVDGDFVMVDGYFSAEMLRVIADWLDAEATA